MLRGDVHATQPGEILRLPKKNILRYGHGGDQAGFLVDHDDACGKRIRRSLEILLITIEKYLAEIERNCAGKCLAKRRFSSAIFADQAMNLAKIDIEIDIIKRLRSLVYLRSSDVA